MPISLREWIINDYREAIALSQAPEDLKASLRSHERYPVFLDRLCKELGRVPKLRRDQIKNSVYDLTNFFIKNVKRYRDEKMMSDVALKCAQSKELENKELEEWVSKNVIEVNDRKA
jgi:hypothetical protein